MTDIPGYPVPRNRWVERGENCAACSKKFTFFTSKTNCPFCGKLCCADCVVAECTIFADRQPSKVCINCFAMIQNHRRTMMEKNENTFGSREVDTTTPSIIPEKGHEPTPIQNFAPSPPNVAADLFDEKTASSSMVGHVEELLQNSETLRLENVAWLNRSNEYEIELSTLRQTLELSKAEIHAKQTLIDQLSVDQRAQESQIQRLSEELQNSNHSLVVLKENHAKELLQCKSTSELTSELEAKLKSYESENHRLNNQLQNHAGVLNANEKLKIGMCGLEERVSALDTEMGALRVSLEERDTDLTRLRVSLEERDIEVAQLRGSLEERDTDLTRLRVPLEERDIEVAQLRGSLEERDIEVAQFRGSLEERDTDLTRLRVPLEERDIEVAQLRGSLEERDTDLTRLRVSLEERDIEVAQLWGSLEERDTDLTRLRGSLEERDIEVAQLWGSLEERDTDLTRLRGSLEERDIEVAQLRGSLEERDIEVAQLRGSLEERDIEVAQLRGSLEERDTDLTRLRVPLEERDIEVAQLRGSLEERDTDLTRLRVSLEERDIEVAQLRGSLEERDTDLTQLRVSLEERDIEVAQLRGSLEERDTDLTRLRVSLEERDAEVAQLRGSLEERDTDLTRLRVSLEERDAEVAALRADLCSRAPALALAGARELPASLVADTDLTLIAPAPACGSFARLSEWGFDVLDAASRVPSVLQAVACDVAVRWALFPSGSAAFQRWARLVAVVENNYRPNPYHNAAHAADVLQGLFALVVATGPALAERLTLVERRAAAFAALAHDVRHPGRTNAFLAAVCDPVALRYAWRGTLEQLHTATAFEILAVPELDFTHEDMSTADLVEFKSIVTALILRTDMSVHADSLARWSARAGQSESGGFDMARAADRVEALALLLHAADIGAAARGVAIARKWLVVMDEFAEQAADERRRGLPVTPGFDRPAAVEPSQIGFLDAIVIPTFDLVQRIFPAVGEPMRNLRALREAYAAAAGVDTPFPKPVDYTDPRTRMRELEARMSECSRRDAAARQCLHDIKAASAALRERASSLRTRESESVKREEDLDARERQLAAMSERLAAAAESIQEVKRRSQSLDSREALRVADVVSAERESVARCEVEERLSVKCEEMEELFTLLCAIHADCIGQEHEMRVRLADRESAVAQLLELSRKRRLETAQTGTGPVGDAGEVVNRLEYAVLQLNAVVAQLAHDDAKV